MLVLSLLFLKLNSTPSMLNLCYNIVRAKNIIINTKLLQIMLVVSLFK